MAADSGNLILAKLVTALQGVGTKTLGVVFDYRPVWRQAIEMQAAARVTIAGELMHRFVTIEWMSHKGAFTSGSDLVIHTFEVELWLAAGIDTQFGKISTTTARTNIRLALSSLSDQQVLNFGAAFCGYPPDGLPREVDPMEYREYLGVVFHVAGIELSVREEVAHV